MLEALPVPYGLVRFGVAPDHPEVKNVIHKFETISDEGRFRFFGNVRLGRDVSLSELRPRYDGIILACGASHDRRLGIPQEDDLPNVFSARAFVGWYNGYPDHRALPVDLTSSDTAVIVGHGNVALDVARILLSPVEELAKTDIAGHALEKLRTSKIRHVHLVGRRGPLQVAFTTKEVREMMALPDTKFEIDMALLENQMEAGAELLKKDRARRRLMDLLHKHGSKATEGSPSRSWSLRFLASPTELITDSSGTRLEGIQFQKNILEGPVQSPRAKPISEFETVKSGLLLRSIGYEITALEGVPFDAKKGIVPNERGRIKEKTGPGPGLYVAGWLKRGPTGVIAATMYDAVETADAVIADVQAGAIVPKQSPNDIEKLLDARGIKPISFKQWNAIDAEEQKRGAQTGKPREKIVDVDEMLQIARRN
ncbi:hypothetical protein HK104_005783 [Borealophlyctis nickersoniae]|nr:hypothetical protein HK104_005783 [Borealophlyctis nickersoniae]